MADPLDPAGAPSWWFDEFTATDSEFLLRADSIVELGTGLRHLTVMAERYVVEHDQRTATEVADASHSSDAVAPDMKDRIARQLGAVGARAELVDLRLASRRPEVSR